MSAFILAPMDRTRLAHIGEVLAAMDGLGLPHLVCLIRIALEPGLSVNDLADRTGFPQQSVSRYLGLLLGRYQFDTLSPSFVPLVDQRIHPGDPRRRALYLTEAGETSIQRLTGAPAR